MCAIYGQHQSTLEPGQNRKTRTRILISRSVKKLRDGSRGEGILRSVGYQMGRWMKTSRSISGGEQLSMNVF